MFHLLLALSAAALAAAETSTAETCASDGETYDNCVRLEDNTALEGETISVGETKRYHWYLEDYSLTEAEPRYNITFSVMPCTGSVNMTLKSGSYSSHDILTQYTATRTGEINSLTLPMRYREHLLEVEASEASTYEVIAWIGYEGDGPYPAVPASNVTSLTYDDTSLEVFWTTSEDPDVEYKLYKAKLSVTDDTQECYQEVDPETLVLDPKTNRDCIMWTACGAAAHGEAVTDWLTYDTSAEVSAVAKDLEEGENYYFSVVVRSTATEGAADNLAANTGRAAAYGGHTTHFAVYSETQLHSDDTIIKVLSSVAASLAVMVAVVFIGKKRMDAQIMQTAYKKKSAGRQPKPTS